MSRLLVITRTVTYTGDVQPHRFWLERAAAGSNEPAWTTQPARAMVYPSQAAARPAVRDLTARYPGHVIAADDAPTPQQRKAAAYTTLSPAERERVRRPQPTP